VCQLTYGNFQSVSGKDELEEFPVHHTGAGASPFTAALPFSWLLYDRVRSTIEQARNSGNSGSESWTCAIHTLLPLKKGNNLLHLAG
jgi:hypothetical protein